MDPRFPFCFALANFGHSLRERKAIYAYGCAALSSTTTYHHHYHYYYSNSFLLLLVYLSNALETEIDVSSPSI